MIIADPRLAQLRVGRSCACPLAGATLRHMQKGFYRVGHITILQPVIVMAALHFPCEQPTIHEFPEM